MGIKSFHVLLGEGWSFTYLHVLVLEGSGENPSIYCHRIKENRCHFSGIAGKGGGEI
jgi:hypothetical protein